MNSGQHLDNFFKMNLKNCSQDVIKKVLQEFKNIKFTCLAGQLCNKTTFDSSITVYEEDTKDSAPIHIDLDSEVYFYTTSISFDWQSLISEIGGVLGITLGASALSLLQSIIGSFSDFFTRSKCRSHIDNTQK